MSTIKRDFFEPFHRCFLEVNVVQDKAPFCAIFERFYDPNRQRSVAFRLCNIRQYVHCQRAGIETQVYF